MARKQVIRGTMSTLSGMSATALASRHVSKLAGGMLFSLMVAAATVHPAFVHPARAEAPCPVPDDLALHNISLPNAKKQVATDQRLVVLTFGGVHDLDANAEAQGATYPARLQAELSGALPHVEVKVANEMPPGKNSTDVPPVLPELIAKSGARVVIWGPGGRDVAA